VPLETTRLIGYRCKHRNMCSQVLLIARTIFMHAFYSYSDFMSVGMNGSLIQKLLEREL
jgi:hypothetical protein